MSNMTEVARATVTIIPNMKGAREKIQNELGGASAEAGQKSGISFGASMGEGIKTGVKAAGAAVAAASTAMVAFGKTAVDAGMSFDSSMSQVAATMGKTMDDLDKEIATVQVGTQSFTGNLREFAQYMGSTTAFSASQAADALNYMALAGYDAKTSMEMLPNVLNLAAAGGIDLAYASDMVTDASSALGLSMDETQDLVNKMAQASSKSNTSVAQLGEAILTVGGTAKNLSGGTTELSTALGILADNGVKGAEGGTALRNIILSLSAPTDTAAKAMAEIGLNAYDAEGNLRPLNEIFGDLNSSLSTMTQGEQTQVLNKMFNKVDLKSVNALLANTAVGFGDLGAMIEDAGVDVEKYAKSNWGCIDSVNGMEVVLDEMKWNLTETESSMEDLVDYFSSEYELDADDVVVMLDTMKKGLEENGTRWDELSGYIEDAGNAAEKMAETQLDNLAGDITLFESAMEGAKIALSDQLTPTLREFVQFGSEGVSKLTESFKEGGLSGMMEEFGIILSDGLTQLVKTLPNIAEAGIQLLEAIGSGIMENMPVMLKAGMVILSMFSDFILQNLPAVVEAAIQIILSIAQGIELAIPSLLPAVIETVMGIGTMLMENLPLLLDAGLGIIMALLEGIVSNIDLIMDGVIDMLMSLVDVILEGIPMILESGARIVLALVDGIVEALPKLIDGALDMLNQFLDAISENPEILLTGFNVVLDIIEGLIKALPKLLEAAFRLITGIFEAFTKINWLDLGINIVKGIIEGMLSLVGSLLDTAVEIAKTAWEGIKSFFGIASPSKLMIYAGSMVGEGLIEGIEIKEPELESTVEDVGMIVKSGVDTEIQTINEAPAAGTGYSEIEAALSKMKVAVDIVLNGEAGSLFEVISQEAKIIRNQTQRGALV